MRQADLKPLDDPGSRPRWPAETPHAKPLARRPSPARVSEAIADHIFSAPTPQAGSDNANDPCTKIGQRNSPSRTLACAPPGRTAATHRIVHKVRQESALIAGLALMSPASQQRAQQMPPPKRRAAPLLPVGPIAPRPCHCHPSAAGDHVKLRGRGPLSPDSGTGSLHRQQHGESRESAWTGAQRRDPAERCASLMNHCVCVLCRRQRRTR